MKTSDPSFQQGCAEWSNRILALSLLGIANLTLFPFKFDFSPTFVFHRYPFLLMSSVKGPSFLDFFLNILLFVPLGFAISAQAGKRGGNRWATAFLALLAGAGVSYLVEVLQFYIPARDSGWMDVISNSTGSVVGFLLCELCGSAILKELSRRENSIEGWLLPRRAAWLFVIYFTVCFGVSFLLQRETRLNNWDPQSILVVGNDASGQNPWRGRVFLLQIWDRALPEKVILRISGGESEEDASKGLLGSYDFTGSPPFRDRTNFLPPLGWTSEQPEVSEARAAELSPRGWLRSQSPAENLTREIRKSSQFTVHIVCAVGELPGGNGRIVSLSQSATNINFQLRQEGQFLMFYFRNAVSVARSALAWRVPGALPAGETRDIFASYDGSDAFVYLDGHRVPQLYRLSPGASLLHRFLFIRTLDLEGCLIVYEELVFLPAGILLGAAARKSAGRKSFGPWMLAVAVLLPALLLEIFLAGVSGRRFWPGNIALSLIFGLAGILLINADRRFKKYLSAS